MASTLIFRIQVKMNDLKIYKEMILWERKKRESGISVF